MLVRPGFEPATSRSADRRSPNWAYQAAVKCVLRDARHKLFSVFKDFYASGTQETKGNKITEHVGKNNLKLQQKSCLKSKNRSHYWFLIDELFHNPVRGEAITRVARNSFWSTKNKNSRSYPSQCGLVRLYYSPQEYSAHDGLPNQPRNQLDVTGEKG